MVFVIFISFCDEETLQAFCLVAVAASAVYFKCNHVIGAAWKGLAMEPSLVYTSILRKARPWASEGLKNFSRK